MRKTPTIVLGLLATAAFAVPAVGQAIQPSHELNLKVSPSKAGTKSKPKSATLDLNIVNDKSAKTTASKIAISFPKQLKINTKGFKTCSAATINTKGVGACPAGANIGSGSANAVLGPDQAPLVFNTTFFVAPKNGLNVYLEQEGESSNKVIKVLPGKITKAGGKYGQKLTISIPADVQQPVPGLYSALVDIDTKLTKTTGKGSKKHGIFELNGCSGGKLNFKSELTYVPNPTKPAASKSTATDSVPCKK